MRKGRDEEERERHGAVRVWMREKLTQKGQGVGFKGGIPHQERPRAVCVLEQLERIYDALQT
jgi:hypothetical protein